jgi:hypothetical protein
MNQDNKSVWLLDACVRPPDLGLSWSRIMQLAEESTAQPQVNAWEEESLQPLLLEKRRITIQPQ